MKEECKHEYKTFQHTRGTNPPIITGSSTWCIKCGQEKPHEESEYMQSLTRWGEWVNRNGDYR